MIKSSIDYFTCGYRGKEKPENHLFTNSKKFKEEFNTIQTLNIQIRFLMNY